MANIHKASIVYVQHARNYGDFMHRLRAAVQNKHGRVLKHLNIGDRVKIYVPPSHSKAVRCHHEAKHICQWCQKAKIVSRIEPKHRQRTTKDTRRRHNDKTH